MANFSSLPNGPLLRIFKNVTDDDLFNLQQVCYKFRTVIDKEKRNEIIQFDSRSFDWDWRLNFTKYIKLKTEISAIGAIKLLEMSQMKKGRCSTRGTYIPQISGLEDIGHRVFNEVILYYI